jgi:hypothetical protein
MPDTPSAKLSPQAARLLSEQPADVEEDRQVDLLIRVNRDAAVGARERLEGSGASVRTEAGDVVTASAPISTLPALAELDEVVAIEVATPLYGESPPTE